MRALLFGAFLLGTAIRFAGDPATKAAPPGPSSAADFRSAANQDFADGKLDLALREISLAIGLDPKNAASYELRSSILVQQKLWDRAERDIQTANQLAPDVAYKFRLGEIRFQQKAYDTARPRFAALQHDPRLGDLAIYKTFLCDLFGGHKAIAAADLAAMENDKNKGSYFFSHAGWALVMGPHSDATKWFAEAQRHFNKATVDIYVSSLVEAQRIQFPIASFTTKDGRKFEKARVSLERAGLRATSADGWVTLPLDQLPDDLSSFPDDLREQISHRLAAAAESAGRPLPVTLTTTSGKTYEQVRWSLHDDGVAVLTPDGWLTVPFDQIPADLSPFPVNAQREIAEKRATATATDSHSSVLTFTTNDGRHFKQLKTTLRPDGLVVLTPDGLVPIPFHDSPADLSAFPAGWHATIESGRHVEAPSGFERIHFTTRDGTTYDDVRATLESTGLHLVTTSGLVRIGFDQVPDDLSAFPESWRPILAAKQKQLLTTSPLALNRNFAATSDLHPPHARDYHFGSCLALDGATLVVGCRGAAYVYIDDRLDARLCLQPDATGTGDDITSVAISDQTIALATPQEVFVLARIGRSWVVQASLNFPGATTVSLDGDNLLATADGRGHAANTTGCFVRRDLTWIQMPRASQPEGDTLSADPFGAVAGVHGNAALIGVPNWSPASFQKGNAAASGRVLVERFDGSSWREDELLTPDDAPTGANQFGGSVALSQYFAAVSSTNHDTIRYAPHHGSVYLFRPISNGWKKEAVLKNPDSSDDSGFGSAPIALSNRTLAVGDTVRAAHPDNVILDNGTKTGKPGSIPNAGAVFIFKGHDLQATLLAPDPVDRLDRTGSPDGYASSLALDGDTMAVGAPEKDAGTGAVYLWRRTKGTWKLKTELKGFHQQSDFNY